MADPLSVSLSLAQINQILECIKYYQRTSGDSSLDATLQSLQTSLNANINPAAPPPDLPSALAQSDDSVT